MEEAKGLIRTIATAEDPSLVRCFRGHEKSVACVAFSKEMYFAHHSGNKSSLEAPMGLWKYGILNLKFDRLSLQVTKVK
jgi:hypothetical protein